MTSKSLNHDLSTNINFNAQAHTLAIVGGGPTCCYAIERLAANLQYFQQELNPIKIYVFEKSGVFGAGEVHSPYQPQSSFLNRIAGQVCFSADETNVGAGPLLCKTLRPTLYEWCQQKYKETADDSYNLSPQDWPKRSQHGEALVDMFARYIGILSDLEHVEVHQICAEVNDVAKVNDRFELSYRGQSQGVIHCDMLLLATGHSVSSPYRDENQRPYAEFADRHKHLQFLNYPYPLDVELQDVGVDDEVAVTGLGLSAIDAFLYFTEGTGGRFVSNEHSQMVYIPSGREPKKLIGYSRSGLFTYARPHNEKEHDITNLEHVGRFFNHQAVDRLRESVGVVTKDGKKQLCFEKDFWPLIHLEQAYIYYKTLFGEMYGDYLARLMQQQYDAFIADNSGFSADGEQATVMFIGKVTTIVSETISIVEQVLNGQYQSQQALPEKLIYDVLVHYLNFISGIKFNGKLDQFQLVGQDFKELFDQVESPWGHELSPRAHIYDWHFLYEPISNIQKDGSFTKQLIAFMEYDHLQARQNNLDNPFKAVCDGMWRDLRQVLSYAIDEGGLLPESHKLFLEKYMRIHNRLGNGACLDVMEKMLALIKAGVLDVSIGPNPTVTLDEAKQRFVITGKNTGETRSVNVLIDAKIHSFSSAADRMPLYRNMLSRGLIKEWSNESASGRKFKPGGIALTEDFHPLNENDEVETNMTLLGPPTEGKYFFQIGAARPLQNHHILNDVVKWVNTYLDSILPARMEYSHERRKVANNVGDDDVVLTYGS